MYALKTGGTRTTMRRATIYNGLCDFGGKILVMNFFLLAFLDNLNSWVASGSILWYRILWVKTKMHHNQSANHGLRCSYLSLLTEQRDVHFMQHLREHSVYLKPVSQRPTVSRLDLIPFLCIVRNNFCIFHDRFLKQIAPFGGYHKLTHVAEKVFIV